ncbi:hypothetical protein [Methylobacterium soli]|uniref:Uncharacterized protein n=1 Tax=Methylobacterium soli TaxID=553447 RepID=A0A6L3SSD0_9HYPH|nr:hypothetical protein [Methylobacterium soli]KAB1076438.1 hypothetical protein F6X53_23220 [Methylobacterium soli]GJE42862.1 hypothetical protein AEGHOMDF_2036 [Methylobacterium soli]
MTYTGPHIILDAVTYRTLGRDEAGRIVTIRDVAYQGVMERRSDGFTVLSVLKPGAARTFNIEVGAVLSVLAHGREWNPETPERRWRLRAEELRAFVEEAEVADWAQPYFDPASDMHHLKQPASKVDRRSSNPAERAASSYRRGGGRRLDEAPAADPPRGTKNAKPGLFRRLWRGLLRTP